MTLATLQRQFRDWLIHGDPAMARQLGDGPGLVVYQNNYRVSLMDALGETFRRTALWLGDTRFAGAAAQHIDAHPPASFTADDYGADFPGTLRRLWPDEPDLAEIAMIDWAVAQAFVSADVVPLAIGALEGVDWDHAAIVPVPALATLDLCTNADALWLALAREETPPALADLPGTLLLWRQQFEPVMRRATATELFVLERARAGISFADTCAALAETQGADAAVAAAGAVLGQWLGEGLVAALSR